MAQNTLFPSWYDNTLYEESYVKGIISAIPTDSPHIQKLDSWLKTHFNEETFKKLSENQLENEFIAPLLRTLGWVIESQVAFSLQGGRNIPDWALFLNEQARDTYRSTSNDHIKQKIDCVTIYLEAKEYTAQLDKAKSKAEKSPHQQLIEYLSYTKKQYGFLTNGQYWRFYDLEIFSSHKAYIQIDLPALLQLTDETERLQALGFFCQLFSLSSYQPGENASSLAEKITQDAYTFASEAEENLKNVIYGTNEENQSMFELMGQSLKTAIPKATHQEIFDNSIILLFRLLFIAYFEDKNHALLDKHAYYRQHGLSSVYSLLTRQRDNYEDLNKKYDGYFALKHLFTILDDGAEDIDIPLFNGGLFAPDRAPLLSQPKIINNHNLLTILERFLYKTAKGKTLFEHRRDYKNMSLTHLGRIYEGLLEYEFFEPQENMVYASYRIGNAAGVEEYLDAYDFANLQKTKSFKLLHELHVKKNSFILRNANNSRKTSASYYTPSELSEHLVKAGIEQALADTGKPIYELKIIDNACGSGHFLVEALAHLTKLAISSLPQSPELQALVDEERAKIQKQIRSLNIEGYDPDDEQILKRALLKRCIYGVDLNPFAVELARLSLWMDSFIFGTPLSFIEHHIQHGNALMGATRKELEELSENFLQSQKQIALDFGDNINLSFEDLTEASHQLSALQDTSTEDIKKSKSIYANQVKPKLEELNRQFSLVCMLKIQHLLDKENKKPAKHTEQETNNKLSLFFSVPSQENGKNNAREQLLRDIEFHQRQYSFFHYEVAFPEITNGFDVIVGNPPWDKVKFADTDFFPRYHSRYRTLKNEEKKQVRDRLLENLQIKSEYDEKQFSVWLRNEYYKSQYPLNHGAGDGNLYRFFVERNLSLLAPEGNLNYVLPSALMLEDGAMTLRRHILSHLQLNFFYSFENRQKLFIDVDSRYKFALMQITNKAPEPQHTISCAFYLGYASDIQDKSRLIDYSVQTIQKLSPHQWAMMELRSNQDLTLLTRCYERFPALDANWLDFRNELHMTADKDLFLEHYQPGLLPLYEGKMIWQFNNRLGPPQYWLNPKAFDKRNRSKEFSRMASDTGIKSAECEILFADDIRYDREYYRLGIRSIASDTNERTLITAMLPKNCGFGHSMFSNISKIYLHNNLNNCVNTNDKSYVELLFANAWFNALITDWIARFMIQINVSKTYLMRIPIPQPTDEEIRENADYAKLAENALLLTLANDWEAFSELAPLFDIQQKDIPNTPKAQDKLRYENDCIVAKLYGISKDELQHILQSFPVMKEKRPEYMTLFNH